MKRVAMLALMSLPLFILGCSEKPRESECICAPSPIVDDSLMAFLTLARSAHHQADLKEQSGELSQAIQALERVQPATLADKSEVKEVMADTKARLADLQGQLGNQDQAEQHIDEGLRFAPKNSYFEGHLHEMRGVNEERRAKALHEVGRFDAEKAARKRAFDSFGKAIDVQEGVIRKALSNTEGKAR